MNLKEVFLKEVAHPESIADLLLTSLNFKDFRMKLEAYLAEGFHRFSLFLSVFNQETCAKDVQISIQLLLPSFKMVDAPLKTIPVTMIPIIRSGYGDFVKKTATPARITPIFAITSVEEHM